MDFSQNRQRLSGAPQNRVNVNEGEDMNPSVPTKAHNKKSGKLGAMKIMWLVLLISATALIVALLLYIRTGSTEAGLIKKNQYQAVFLNGGQVYFGKLSSVDSKSMQISDIYYLRVEQQVQPDGKTATSNSSSNQDISLAKLGNELHGPEDKMIINRDQILFWENLKDDGQVVKAITEYKKNPTAANNSANTTNTTTNSTTK